jgi:transposase
MDANASHFLVSLPPEHGSLVPVSSALIDDLDFEPDLLALLWRCFGKLALLFFLALAALRRTRLQLIELRLQANYWRAQHQRAVQREAISKEEIQRLQGEIRELERRLYGRKSETAAATQPESNPKNPNIKIKKRPRGQQSGSKGHGRRHHDHLPAEHEYVALPTDQQCCADCGQPLVEIPGSADGDILEIEVKAHRRRYHRQRYRATCTCPNQPAVVTAPPPDKLIPKSNIGISLWVLILTRKYEFFQPLYRVVAELRRHDLHLPTGTIIGGLQKLVLVLQPLYELLVEHNRNEGHWHCDETRWLVFVKRTDKTGFCWNLWVFAAKESIVFVLDPTRAHDVPEGHFGADAEGIINVDRYSAYKAMAQVKSGKIILAFCWAHVRRDFLAVLTSWTELTDWAWSWVEEIGLLYQLNDKRLSLQQVETPGPEQTPAALTQKAAYVEADQCVRTQVEHMRERRDQELAQPNLRQPQRKVLKSLVNHWAGLTVFVDHPEVPMDNNEAERRHRGPVVARKNYYGSGALWSGRLAAMLFSLFQTLQLWGMDTGKWLAAYLSACAKANGKPPPDLQSFMPWKMTIQERERMSVAKHLKPPDAALPDANHPTASKA